MKFFLNMNKQKEVGESKPFTLQTGPDNFN